MTLNVKIDWQRDGYGAFGIDDVTALVRPRQGAVTANYGRDQSTALAPIVAGSGSLVLDNRDRRFSPRNTASPLYGYMKPSRPVRISRTVSATEYVLFVAHTDDSPINPDVNTKTVTLSLIDSLADFRGLNISTSLYSGIRTGEAIGKILDACGWDASLRDIDPGATIISWWWEDNTDALTALDKLVRSEGPPAMLTVGADGSIVFRDRHHRLLDTASLTSQQTWRNIPGPGNPTIHREGFSYDEAWRNIVNAGAIDVDVRTPRETTDVWTSDATFTLAASESRDIIASSSDPFYDAIIPVDGIDYESVTGSINVKLSRLSGASTIITMTAVGGAAIIRGLKLRAKPVQTAYTVQVATEDWASVNDYGRRSYPGDLPFCSPGDAQAILDTTVGLRAQPVPIITARFVVGRDPKQIPVLARDLSERVTIVESELNLNDEFFVESIGHELTGEHDHTVIFGVEATPVQPTPVFQLDTAGAGADQGYLSNPAIYPANLLILDSSVAGHRADEGLCAW